MIRAARRLSRLFLLAFVLIAGGLGYWGVISQEALRTRQDNPRRVLAEQSIQQGKIVDRDGATLVDSLPGAGQGQYVRHYPHPEAAPVVGYYSLRHGTGGIESAFASTLHGDRFVSPAQAWVNGLLHRSQVGGDVQLTLSLPIQEAVRNALQGQRGAIVVIDAASGDVLAMDSLPTYDPTTLDEMWDELRADPSAPLLNRATQALYQPGSVLQGVVLGEAVNNGAIRPEDAWSGRLAGHFQDASLPCASNQAFTVRTYADAFVWGCPGATQALGGLLGLSDLKRGYSDFGLEEAPPFDLPVAAAAAPVPEDDPETAAIGQGRLTVTPLHMALVTSAFANHGQMPAPRLVSAVRPPGQGWQPMPVEATPRGTISSASADTIRALMRQAVESGATHAASSTQRGIYGYAGLALSGPGFSFNTWFVGFTYDDGDRPIAIAILLEGSQDVDRASRIGGQLLAEAAALLKN